MFGIYKYEMGLKFTGKVATSKEKAEEYLGNKYGTWMSFYVGCDEFGKLIYEERFVPGYNKDAFKIIELEIIE